MDIQIRKFRCNKIAVAIVAAISINVSALAMADVQQISLNIKSQKIGSALMELSARSGVHIMLEQSAGDSVRFSGIEGTYTLQAALDQMLEGSGLIYEFVADDSVLVKEVNQAGDYGKNVEKTGSEMIEEMVVTASKRETTVQDTPISITALGNEELDKRGVRSMEDYLNSIPGVAQTSTGTGQNLIVMRGIAATSFDEASVGVYLGEVLMSGIANVSATDVRMVDIDRVEVLRGPQGTLYGAGSMAGAIRIIPNAPDLEEFSFDGSLGYSQTAMGGDNTKATATFNFPIVKDQLALRMVAYEFNDDGYIENVGAEYPAKAALADQYGALLVGQEGSGSVDSTGLRASLLWKPADDFDVTLSYTRDRQEQLGYNAVDPAAESAVGRRYVAAPFSLALANISAGNETLKEDIEAVNLLANYDLGSMTLVSSTSWFSSDSDFARDAGRVIPFPLPQQFDSGKSGVIQELRLVSSFDGPLQFTAGVYYDDLKRHINSVLFWGGDIDLNPFGITDPSELLYASNVDWNIKQKALFGEVSYDLADTLTLTVGGRLFEYDRLQNNVQSGPLAGAGVTLIDDTSQDGDSFKANLSFQPNDDTLFYGQWAQGFRVGQGTSTDAPAAVCDLDNDGFLDGTQVPISPGVLDSDNLDSYELGSKFSLLDQRLKVAVSVFYNEWEGIPVFVSAVPNCGFTVKVNAGNATSEGVEIESDFYLTESFKLSISGSYVDAKLAETSSLGPKDTKLPGAAKVSFYAAANYDFEAFGYPAFTRLDANYIGKFHSDIAQGFAEVGGYTLLNLRAGLTRDNIRFNIYAQNLTNADDLTYSLSSQSFRLRPRTVGIEVGYEF